MNRLADFTKIKVLIVGDIMIDRYCWGSVERISPEAPVPVVRLHKTTLVAGGAANVAVNVAGLGAQAFLVGVHGDDEEAKLFPNLLSEQAISSKFLIKIKNRPTTVKTRIIAHSQQVARTDQEANAPISDKDTEKLWRKTAKLIEKADIVIISDYAKGLLSEELITRLITTTHCFNKLILVDPKGKSFSKYENADILTPNQREVAEACGLEQIVSDSIENCGRELVSELKLKSLLVTRGEDGMMLLENDKETLHLKASARKVYDVTGAGDTVIATLATALGAGINLPDAAELANIAAGLVVEQVGTTAIKFETLRRELENRSNNEN